jgi:hypothetical protein
LKSAIKGRELIFRNTTKKGEKAANTAFSPFYLLGKLPKMGG